MIIESKDNPRVRRWAKLARDGRFRRAEKAALIEGPHLIAALLDAKLDPVTVMVSERGLGDAEIRALLEKRRLAPVELSDSAFRAIGDVETPQGIAAEIRIPAPREAARGSCVFLEGIQDAGNVGAIIRSAAAFGVATVVLDQACADPWSPKVLRAAMGGHFGLSIRAIAAVGPELSRFGGRLICTVARGGLGLDKADLSGTLGWVFGSEGKGVSAQALAEADLKVTIRTAPATESLNVAAAAAICFYAAFSRPGAGS